MLPLLLACMSPAAPPAPSISLAPAEAAPAPTLPEPAPAAGWVKLEPGLDFATFEAPKHSELGDSLIRVLRVDPHIRELVLVGGFTLPAGQGVGSARQWSELMGLSAAINASMFREDYLTSTHGMRAGTLINNPNRGEALATLVFGPRLPGAAPAAILDVSCEDIDALARGYENVVSSIRMLSCRGEDVWGQSQRRWSHAAIGEDSAGNILFLHARSPWSTHDFIENARVVLPELVNLQYAEGGPEAQLYVHAGGLELEAIGSYETGFYEKDDNRRAWEIPNVVGVKAQSVVTVPADQSIEAK